MTGISTFFLATILSLSTTNIALSVYSFVVSFLVGLLIVSGHSKSSRAALVPGLESARSTVAG